jgi:inner membrane protein
MVVHRGPSILPIRAWRQGKWQKIFGFGICDFCFLSMLTRVDILTHAVLGAAMGELLMGSRMGNRALILGALMGVMPEITAWLNPFLDTAHQLDLHRGPSHSLLVMALGSYGLARATTRFWAKWKISRIQAFGFIFTLWCVHVLADCFGSQGAALGWPISASRVCFNHLYETDVLYVAPLFVTAVGLIFLRESAGQKTRGKSLPPVSKRKRWCHWGLGLSFGYVVLSVAMKWLASSGFEADLERRKVTYERRMEAPTPYNILFWRSVVDRGDELWVGYRSVFEFHETPVRWTIYPKHEDAIEKIADLRQTRTLLNHTGGWWIARPHVKGAWLGDLQQGEARLWEVKKGMVDSRPAHSWVIDASATHDALRPGSRQEQPTHEILARIAARLIGKREQWESNPRLSGIAGSLPEFLAVQE